MKKFYLVFLLLAVPAWGQGQPTPLVKPAAKGAARVDNCAPIGRTANGELVYVKLGQYAHESDLEEDIRHYALGGA